MKIENITDGKRKITILGAGESGTGAAILAARKGYEVFVSDSGKIAARYKTMLDAEKIHWEEGMHTPELVLCGEEIVKSPGIPPTAPIVEEAVRQGIPIIDEIEFAARYTRARMICITGSNGKTTTTKLIYHIFREAGMNVGLAGNVGQSLALQIANGAAHDFYVLELSSFQLENMHKFHAHIAVILNITPDHLDRYNNSIHEYAEAKLRITQNQTPGDAVIYWSGDPMVEEASHRWTSQTYPFGLKKTAHDVAYIKDGKVRFTNIDLNVEQDSLALRGNHNILNSMAAGLSAAIAGIKKDEIRSALSSFEAISHRMEAAGEYEGVTYINDSKATNVNACWYALDSMTTPVVLILGGVDKGNDYSELDVLVREKCRALVFLGVDNSKLHAHFDAFALPTVDVTSMSDCVREAHQMAQAGDTVLLSPCCASFDLFDGMADRGNQFKQAVEQLKASQANG